MMHWPFAKYVGCGNDFIFFDNRSGQFPLKQPALFSKLCHRQFGIGADGVILLESSPSADCRMRIFNPDNSEAEMCGNGLRCFIRWIKTLGFEQPLYTIETMQRLIKAAINGNNVSVDMGLPKDVRWNLPVKFLDQQLLGHFMNTGVPHLVIFVQNVDDLDLNAWGPAIQSLPDWKPDGTNVNFAEIISGNRIKLRTYERGVGGETLACGTGATAAALVAASMHRMPSPMTVEVRSKEILTIECSDEQVKMIGPAHCTYCGQIDLSLL